MYNALFHNPLLTYHELQKATQKKETETDIPMEFLKHKDSTFFKRSSNHSCYNTNTTASVDGGSSDYVYM